MKEVGSHILPLRFREVYSKERIQTEILRIAEEISEWASTCFQSSSRDLLAVPIMRGGLYFAADLTRALSCSVEVQTVRSVSYVNEEIGVQLPDIHFEMSELNPSGRDILLIDDICDSGRTIRALSEQLLAQGAKDVRSAVLIHRVLHENSSFSPHWECFRYHGSEWFVGYGMEELDRFRNLPSVHIIVDETLND